MLVFDVAHKVCDTLNQLHTHGNIRLECTNNDKFKSVGSYSLSVATANRCRITANIRQHKECSCIPAHLHTAYAHICTPTCINIAVHTCAAHQNICKVKQPTHSHLHAVMHTHTLPKVCSHMHAITHALTCKHPRQAMVLRNSQPLSNRMHEHGSAMPHHLRVPTSTHNTPTLPQQPDPV